VCSSDLGLASSRGLRATRKYAVVGILLVAALVTPPDVTTQLILFVVVYGLYEISIFLVAYVERQKDVAARKEGIIADDESLFDIDDDDDDDVEEDPMMKDFYQDDEADEDDKK